MHVVVIIVALNTDFRFDMIGIEWGMAKNFNVVSGFTSNHTLPIYMHALAMASEAHSV